MKVPNKCQFFFRSVTAEGFVDGHSPRRGEPGSDPSRHQQMQSIRKQASACCCHLYTPPTIPLSFLSQFVSALSGNAVEIASSIFAGLSRLCEDFGFKQLSARRSEFHSLVEPNQRTPKRGRRSRCLKNGPSCAIAILPVPMRVRAPGLRSGCIAVYGGRS
jgi:hypothetical protein